MMIDNDNEEIGWSNGFFSHACYAVHAYTLQEYI